MAYDTPTRHSPSFDGVNLANAFSRTLIGPKGKRGAIRGISGSVTTAITGGQALATITGGAPNVQTSPSTPNTNAMPVDFSFPIPLQAAGTAFTSTATPSAVQRDANNFVPILAADTPFVFAIVPGAGGAGVADLELDIDWF